MRRREARVQHARILREAGKYQEALSALEGVRDPRAEPERLLALAGTRTRAGSDGASRLSDRPG